MAEEANSPYDPGGEGGGFGGGSGSVTLDDEDAGFDEVVDKFNESNRKEHELNDPSDNEGSDAKKPVAHNPNAPVGSKENPVVIPPGRGKQY
jgi:hypothetical protein